jgi:hypothetical protein
MMTQIESMRVSSGSFFFAVVGLVVARLGVAENSTKFPLDEDDWFVLTNHAGGPLPADCGYNFCATVKNRATAPGTQVVLDTCVTWSDEEGWRLWTAPDGNGFLFMLGNGDGYAGNKKAMCMQAGYGEELGSRARIRLAACDIDSPLQRFVLQDYNENCGENEGGKVKLQSRKDLCLTWNGNTVEAGVTRVIVMPCKDLKGKRAKGWFVR